MADKRFCNQCGAEIPQDSQFCLRCGTALTGTPSSERGAPGPPQSRQGEASYVEDERVPTYEQYSPQYPPPKEGLLSDLGASFWLGFVGGVFGILGGVLALIIGSLSYSFSGTDSDLYLLGFGALLFSVLGIVGGVFEKQPKVGGTLMIISAIGILISISYLGILSCIMFLLGGILIFARSRRPKRRAYHPPPAYR